MPHKIEEFTDRGRPSTRYKFISLEFLHPIKLFLDFRRKKKPKRKRAPFNLSILHEFERRFKYLKWLRLCDIAGNINEALFSNSESS